MHVVVIILRIILWLLLGLIVLLLLTPVGADIGYEDGVIRLAVTVWGMKRQLLPKPPAGPEKPKKEKPKKEKPEMPKEEKPKKKRGLPVSRDELPDLLLRLLRRMLQGFGRFGRKFRVDRFRLVYLAAGHDPYTVAMSYGWLNAALSTLAPICERRFSVRDCEVRTAIDFTEDWPRLDLGLAFSIRIGRLLGTVFDLGFGAAGIFLPAILRHKRELKKAPPAEAETDTETAAETEEISNDRSQLIQERKDSNG